MRIYDPEKRRNATHGASILIGAGWLFVFGGAWALGGPGLALLSVGVPLVVVGVMGLLLVWGSP